jgi:hypothetical protein
LVLLSVYYSLLKTEPTIDKTNLKRHKVEKETVIRQCLRLSEMRSFQGCIKAAAGGRNQGEELELHKGLEGDEVDTHCSRGK